jgi:hypothetical protein
MRVFQAAAGAKSRGRKIPLAWALLGKKKIAAAAVVRIPLSKCALQSGRATPSPSGHFSRRTGADGATNGKIVPEYARRGARGNSKCNLW